jgi:membrane protease subunit HflC
MDKKIFLVLIPVVMVVAAYFSLFTVDEREKAILFRLGEIVKSDYAPGLYFKMPLVNNVRKFDARIQTHDAQPERYLTSEKKNVIVDTYVKWRIADVGQFYTRVAGDYTQANLRLDQIVKDGLRSEFSKRDISEVVSGERAEVMAIITEAANLGAQQLGIEVVDVRVMRIDLPLEVSNSVYRRMEAERTRVSRDFRSRGAEAAERIRADADRQRTILLAEAYRDSELVRGEGDARAAETYAAAYNKNPEFYSLSRSLNAYRQVFSSQQDVLLIQPDSQFFQHFNKLK